MQNIKTIIALALLVFFFTACDKVDAPYKVEVEKPKTEKHAFLEFYTGHLDANAPAALETIKMLKEEHGDKLSIMAIHAGSNADVADAPFTVDYKTTTGDEYFSYFNIVSSNKGMVDREEYEGQKVLDPASWAASIDTILSKDGEIKMTLSPILNEELLNGSVALEFFNAIDSQLKLQLYLVEDSLTSAQQTDAGVDESFIHRYVLRDVLNGDMGENLPEASYEYGAIVDLAISDYTIPAFWNRNRLSIIAIVYNEITETVIQVTEKPIFYSGPELIVPQQVKRVLIEDYTGHKCPNCPFAAETAHEIQLTYGDDKVILTAIHGIDWFAAPAASPYEYDFRTPEGNEYISYFGVASLPNGAVNRVQNSEGNHIFDRLQWATITDTLLQQETSLDILIYPTITGNTISGEVQLYFFEEFNTECYVQIYITENNIIEAQQKSGVGDILDYNHSHVFRGATNGAWGDQITSSSFSAEETYTVAINNYDIGDDWKIDDLSIVAYVYDAVTKEIIQVNKRKLIN